MCFGQLIIGLTVKLCLRTQDKDVTEASSHILDLTGRLRDLETSLTQRRSQESKLLRDFEENKHRYREARREVAHLKGRRVDSVARVPDAVC